MVFKFWGFVTTVMLSVGMPLSYISDLNDFQMLYSDQFIVDGTRRSGGYNYEEKVVKLYKGATRDTVVHEIGHHICYKYNHPKIFGRGESMLDFVSEYAMTNNREDCAETIEWFYTHDFKIRNVCARSRILCRKVLQVYRWHNINVKLTTAMSGFMQNNYFFKSLQ